MLSAAKHLGPRSAARNTQYIAPTVMLSAAKHLGPRTAARNTQYIASSFYFTTDISQCPFDVRRIIAGRCEASIDVGTRFIASQAGWGGWTRIDLEGHSASQLCDHHHSTPQDVVSPGDRAR
jgi:hypothetical protein